MRNKKLKEDKKKLRKGIVCMWRFICVAYLVSFGILLYSAITESWIRFFVGLIFFIVTGAFHMGMIELEKKLEGE